MDTLTSDLLICVCAHLPAASACQLRSSYRAALEALDPAWLAHQRGAPTGVATFEQLALHEALTALETSRITFEGASRDIQSSSMPAVSEYARLLRRHPRASAHVDAHTGVHAPSSFAPAFTCERARSVVSELVAQGVAASRLTSTGWGKAIAVAAGWPPGCFSARAEVRIVLPKPQLVRPSHLVRAHRRLMCAHAAPLRCTSPSMASCCPPAPPTTSSCRRQASTGRAGSRTTKRGPALTRAAHHMW